MKGMLLTLMLAVLLLSSGCSKSACDKCVCPDCNCAKTGICVCQHGTCDCNCPHPQK